MYVVINELRKDDACLLLDNELEKYLEHKQQENTEQGYYCEVEILGSTRILVVWDKIFGKRINQIVIRHANDCFIYK